MELLLFLSFGIVSTYFCKTDGEIVETRKKKGGCLRVPKHHGQNAACVACVRRVLEHPGSDQLGLGSTPTLLLGDTPKLKTKKYERWRP